MAWRTWKYGSILPCVNDSGYWWWYENIENIVLENIGTIGTNRRSWNPATDFGIVADDIPSFMTTVNRSSGGIWSKAVKDCYAKKSWGAS